MTEMMIMQLLSIEVDFNVILLVVILIQRLCESIFKYSSTNILRTADLKHEQKHDHHILLSSIEIKSNKLNTFL